MKKIFNVLIACVLVVTATAVSAAASSFKDVPSTHWAYKYINPMVEKGIVNGYEGNVFKPNGNVTRAEWAKLLTVTANIPVYEDYQTIMQNACLDAKPTAWHAAYTVALLPYFDYSFAEGDNGELYFTCEASKPVTRLEMAKSIVRVAGYDQDAPDYSLIKGFKDYGKIPSDDRKYVAIAVEKGIVSGFEDNTFRPLENVTRAQAATMLYRTFIGEGDSFVSPVFNTAEYYLFFRNLNISSKPVENPVKPAASPYAAYAGDYEYSDSLDCVELSILIENSALTVNGTCVCFAFDIITPATINGTAQIVDGTAEFVVKDDRNQNVLVLVSPKEENILGYNLKTLEVEFTSNRNSEGAKFTLYNVKDAVLANSYNTIKAHCPGTYSGKLTKVDLKLNGNMLMVDFESQSSSDEMTCRNAFFSSNVDLSKSIIAEYKVSVPFSDTWGNDGVLIIEFNPGNGGPMLRCSIEITKYGNMALYWAESNPDEWLM